MTGRSGCALLKYCSPQCTLLCARMSWHWMHTLCSCLQVGSCLCMGRNVEMWGFLANGQHCAINYWSDSFAQSSDCELVGSFVGPDFTLRGGGCVLQCVRVEYKARRDLDLLVELRSVDACSCRKSIRNEMPPRKALSLLRVLAPFRG